jgi:hypothetical protein
VPNDLDPFFEIKCNFTGNAVSVDFRNQFCECADGWTGEYCDILEETNSTEVNVTEYVDVPDHAEDNGTIPIEETGNGTVFFAAGVASRSPQSQTGPVRT